ncbi:Nuclear receptor sub 2 group F member 5 [Clonorchis sinensis]|uniref:Nuclear receptor sub 2 group F member 5 n=1 Tax=Clonorchis sinensis TaxID=79923 RepID=A0A3R7JNI0_CLOSI|nr:Nuclear receptor sub 2 group F member 5 [Clonorchis sinensis]
MSPFQLHDQLSLIQNAWPELFVINVAQASTSHTPESFRSHNSPELFEATPAGTNSQSLCYNLSPNRKSPCSQEGIDATRSNSKEEIPSTSELVDRFQDQVDRLRMLQLDMAEFVSLKGILLFNAEAPGLCDSATVECIQEKIQSALEEYDRGQFSHTQPFRFGRLLLRLPRLRQVTGEWIKRLFFPHFDKQVSVEQLIREVLYHGPPPVGSNGMDQPTVLDLSPESNTIPVGTLTKGLPQCTPEKPEGINYQKTNYHSATGERLLNTSGSCVRPLLNAERKYSDPLRGIRSIPIGTDLSYLDQNITSKNVPFPFPLMYTSLQHPFQRCLEHNFVRSTGHHAKDVNFTVESGLQHHHRSDYQSRPPDPFSTAIRTRTGCNPHFEFRLGMPLPQDPVTCLSTEAVEKALSGITTTMNPVSIDSKNTSLLNKKNDESVLFDSMPSSTASHITTLQLYYAVMRQQLQMLHKHGLPAWSDNVTEAVTSVTSPPTPTVHPNADSSDLSKI